MVNTYVISSLEKKILIGNNTWSVNNNDRLFGYNKIMMHRISWYTCLSIIMINHSAMINSDAWILMNTNGWLKKKSWWTIIIDRLIMMRNNHLKDDSVIKAWD
jgi:hypothetical protein